VQVFKEYFHEMEEESIRDNFVIVYELLDEMMDYGFPQSTESKILKEYITQESHKLDLTALKPPPALTQAVSWRKEGIRYKKNEVFLDVVEKVNLLINANGVPVRSEIVGAIKMRSQLSGMPELRLGLNDRVQFEATGRGKLSLFLSRTRTRTRTRTRELLTSPLVVVGGVVVVCEYVSDFLCFCVCMWSDDSLSLELSNSTYIYYFRSLCVVCLARLCRGCTPAPSPVFQRGNVCLS
jgi:Adaptor complexes medium subunit family